MTKLEILLKNLSEAKVDMQEEILKDRLLYVYNQFNINEHSFDEAVALIASFIEGYYNFPSENIEEAIEEGEFAFMLKIMPILPTMEFALYSELYDSYKIFHVAQDNSIMGLINTILEQFEGVTKEDLEKMILDAKGLITDLNIQL